MEHATAPLTTRTLAWLTQAERFCTPSEVAEGIGADTTKTANTLLYLASQGRVLRKRGKHRNGIGSSTYAAPTTSKEHPNGKHPHPPGGGSR